jgi:predicted O-methyltransferase YrrM
MFNDIPAQISGRMRQLEEMDARDRTDGTTQFERLRQVTPEIGRFIALLAASAPDGVYLEIGTSGGYSALWLALACREVGRKITTFEISEDKAAIARETFSQAGVEDVVKLVVGDARDHIREYENISFCFLDAEKKDYGGLYELVVPRMVQGGLLVADNAVSHADILAPVLTRAQEDERVDALVVPIGRGELVCRRL